MSLCVVAPCVFASVAPARNALVNFVGEYAARTGVQPPLVSIDKTSNVAKARYHLGKRALHERVDWFLWIDDDIVFTFHDALRVLNTDKDVVSGCYIQKTIGGGIVCHPTPTVKQELPLISLDMVGFGFLAMRYHVLEAAIAAKAFACRPSETHDDVEGEDESFSKWWRQRGGELWLHTEVAVDHVGLYTYACPRA